MVYEAPVLSSAEYWFGSRSPLIPAGVCTTAVILMGGLKSFTEGNRRKSQLFMRARVVAQGVTVAAMMGCLAWQGMQKEEQAKAAVAAKSD